MSAMASQITRLTIVYSTVYSGADQRKHQSSASLAFVKWIHRLETPKFPYDDVIVATGLIYIEDILVDTILTYQSVAEQPEAIDISESCAVCILPCVCIHNQLTLQIIYS